MWSENIFIYQTDRELDDSMTGMFTGGEQERAGLTVIRRALEHVSDGVDSEWSYQVCQDRSRDSMRRRGVERVMGGIRTLVGHMRCDDHSGSKAGAAGLGDGGGYGGGGGSTHWTQWEGQCGGYTIDEYDVGGVHYGWKYWSLTERVGEDKEVKSLGVEETVQVKYHLLIGQELGTGREEMVDDITLLWTELVTSLWECGAQCRHKICNWGEKDRVTHDLWTHLVLENWGHDMVT
ncbi:hypothetical protein Tco_1217454 [Tanacetum coccineum]